MESEDSFWVNCFLLIGMIQVICFTWSLTCPADTVVRFGMRVCVCGKAAAAKSLQLCLTVRPHRRQPTRLPHPWDSPGKNTGVGCHFLLQCMKVKSESEVAQSCPTPSDPMDFTLPGSSIHGIFQARVLEWSAIAFSSVEKSLQKSLLCFNVVT